jgi:hypothetical protein
LPQHFAIQKWRDAGDIKLVHIARRLMGHFGPPSPLASSVESQVPSLLPPVPGEGVDAHSLVSSRSSRPSVIHPSPSSDPCSRRSPPGPYQLSSPRDPCCLASLASDIPVSCPDCSAPTDPCRSSQDPDLIGLFPSSLYPSHLDSS